MAKREFEIGEVVSFENPDRPGQQSGVITAIYGDTATVALDGGWDEPQEVDADISWLY